MAELLEKEDWDELSEIVADAINEEEVSHYFLEVLLKSNPSLEEDASEWGFSDSEVKRNLLETISQFLLEREWKDEADDEFGDESCEEFKESLNVAYRSWEEDNE